MTGEGVAAIIASLGAFVTALGGVILQLRGQTESRNDRAKLGDKIDNNTALTKETAKKVEEVHAVQVSTSGTYPTIKLPDIP